MRIVAVDPGTAKCGVAVVDGEGRVPHRAVVPTERLVTIVLRLVAAHAPERVLVGDGTQSAPIVRALRDALPESLPVTPVPEGFTSQRARARYLAENPPSGLSRLLPRGLRTPPVPIDDYVAVLLAEDWLARFTQA
jgi:RNase H-fold protein (predicted Holliday junction resolvase)